MSRSTTQKLRLLVLTVALSAIGGGLYAVIRAEPDEIWAVEAAIGATIGSVISFCINWLSESFR